MHIAIELRSQMSMRYLKKFVQSHSHTHRMLACISDSPFLCAATLPHLSIRICRRRFVCSFICFGLGVQFPVVTGV